MTGVATVLGTAITTASATGTLSQTATATPSPSASATGTPSSTATDMATPSATATATTSALPSPDGTPMRTAPAPLAPSLGIGSCSSGTELAPYLSNTVAVPASPLGSLNLASDSLTSGQIALQQDPFHEGLSLSDTFGNPYFCQPGPGDKLALDYSIDNLTWTSKVTIRGAGGFSVGFPSIGTWQLSEDPPVTLSLSGSAHFQVYSGGLQLTCPLLHVTDIKLHIVFNYGVGGWLPSGSDTKVAVGHTDGPSCTQGSSAAQFVFTANVGASLGLGQSLGSFGAITPLKLNLSVFYKDAITGPTSDHPSFGVSLGAGTSIKIGPWSLSWSLANLQLAGDLPPPDSTPVMPVPPTDSADVAGWNGHAVTGRGDFTHAHGSWIVPTVTPTGDDRGADTWLGLGGLPEGTAQLRAGTSERSVGGHPTYSAWYEWLGGVPRQYLDSRYPVGPGDRIDVSFERAYVDPLGSSAYYDLHILDNPPGANPTHDTWLATKRIGPVFPSYASVNWIHAPASGLSHLAVTSPVQFMDGFWDVDGRISGQPIAAGGDQRLQAPADSVGVAASVSGLDGAGTGFTVAVIPPAPTATPPPPPTSTPVPSCGYPTNIYGPGPGCPYFTTSGPWYRDGGHAGLAGQQIWTYSRFSSGQNAVAEWRPLLNPNTWVDVKAYIPAGTADAKVGYYVTDGDATTTRVSVDQGPISNAWVDLGTYWSGTNDQSRVYGITVHLDNDFGYSSSGNVHAGADAVWFRGVRNCPAGCPPPGPPPTAQPTATPVPPPPTSTPTSAYGDITYGPGSGPFFTTSGWWQRNAGNGVIGQALWTYANADGSTQSTATWNPTSLRVGSGCYNVQAFIPNDSAEVRDAHYTVSDATGSYPVQVNQDSSSGYVSLGYYLAANGSIRVTLSDRGQRGDAGIHVDADAMRFQLAPSRYCTAPGAK